MLRKLTTHLFICLFLISVAAKTRAQTSEITGIVKDETGQPLLGASILLLNTKTNEKKGIMVNTEGKFIISGLSANVPYSISASYIGYTTKTIDNYVLKAGEQATLLIQLNPASASLTDVVVVGYGSQKKKDVTTSIASIKASDLENQPINNAAEAMVGKMAGVQVSQGSGTPGGALAIKVRGVGTITAGSNPLYVIDGVPISNDNINTLNTNDIASIEVLKDASSAAIYGSRGSNGVVLITTKQGKSGKATISANSYAGWQTLGHKIDMMDAYQYAQMTLESRNNTYADQMDQINRKNISLGLPIVNYSPNDNNSTRLVNAGINSTSALIPLEIFPYLQGQQGLTNTDWQNEIFRTAPIQSHSVSASGGGENLKYYASMEYFDQDGIILNSGFKRYSGRLNLEGNRGVFRYGVNLSPSSIKENRVNANGAYSTNGGGIVSSALHYSPIFPVYNTDGTYSFAQNSWSPGTITTLPGGATQTGNGETQAWNPVALAMLQKDDVRSNRLTGSAFVEASILKELKYKIQLGIDLFNSSEDTFRPSIIPQSNFADNRLSDASGSSRTIRESNWLLEQTLNYNKSFGDHNINALLGWSTQKDDLSGNYALATKGFISDQVEYLNAGIVTSGTSTRQQWSLASGIARLQYSYKGKYLFTGSVRADGSSKFGTNNKWGYFPSASIGWRLSEEDFLKNSKSVSDLKLRASYGLTGNFNIPNYAAQGYVGNYAYVFGGSTPGVVNGAAPLTQPNDDLRWEKTAQLNIGFDAAFFRNQLTLSVDVYNSNTNDLLLNVPVPLSTGFSTELKNIGKVNNKGIDINLGTQQQFGAVKWTANANFSKNKNKVVELGSGVNEFIRTGSVANAYFLTRVGEPIGSYYLPVVLGVFKNQAEVNAYPHYTDTPGSFDLNTAKPGDFKFKDVDGDGAIDLTKDREIVGNYLPKFTYGFSTAAEYKGIDLNVALQGVYGNKILNLSRRYFANKEGNMNNMISSLDRWVSESNPGSGQDVRANRVAKGSNGTTSTWHVEDGSYLRIRNIAVGYTFPADLVKKIALTKVRLYVAMQNPFTFTKYTGYNPEVTNRSEATTNGEDYGVYPTAKTTSIGLNITL
ncbi:SusC/RagA family TonB-linked outer membrane protein [Pedobacter punctiformis]|uniref:TonB-dependent receptor n=1 Tax=Pedobacter punctiformis TaxID=3004097 RepID=A0ABT4L5D2_9SPHI|nr:TonB-dependent receptor [Pedobacter sp. HCMS5-2]MCZ4243127.1 TonB-dependent receptor [Pedobacter sp. HCMS5-2]